MTNELSTERAIEALYTVRAYYASLTAGYPKGKDCRGIGDVMCSEIANSCLMAIQALEQTRWIPIKWHEITDEERVIEEYPNEWLVFLDCQMPYDGERILVQTKWGDIKLDECYIDDRISLDSGLDWIDDIVAWMPLPQPYGESEDEE